jgi:hypothetical protein
MKPGEISNVVETDFGYHIIRWPRCAAGRRSPSRRCVPRSRPRCAKAGAEALAEAAEQFTNIVYEQSDSLQPVVDKLKLEKKTATVQRTPAPAPPGPAGIDQAAGGGVRQRSRGQQAQHRRGGSGPNQLVAARIVQHSRPHAAAGRSEGQGACQPRGQAGGGAGPQGRRGPPGGGAEAERGCAAQHGRRVARRRCRVCRPGAGRRSSRRRRQAAGRRRGGPRRAGLPGGASCACCRAKRRPAATPNG